MTETNLTNNNIFDQIITKKNNTIIPINTDFKITSGESQIEKIEVDGSEGVIGLLWALMLMIIYLLLFYNKECSEYVDMGVDYFDSGLEYFMTSID